MSKFRKMGLVLAGYLIAPVAAALIDYLLASIEAANDPGGMAAFGDLLFFLGLTGLFALIPTALALYFLRPVALFWTFLAIACAALAATGPVAAILAPRLQAPDLPQFLALMRALGAPLIALGFLVVALIAPTGGARRILLAAMALEGATGAYVFFSLLVIGRWIL